MLNEFMNSSIYQLNIIFQIHMAQHTHYKLETIAVKHQGITGKAVRVIVPVYAAKTLSLGAPTNTAASD